MITQRVTLTAQDARKVSVDKLHRLGAIAETEDGRVYRYAKAGATVVVGTLQVNPDLVANHVNRPVAAAVAIGGNQVTATLGATAATLDQYEDGYLTVNDATGEGIQYAVAGNSAANASAVITVKLRDDEPVKVALVATTSEVTLKPSNWGGTVISAVDQADMPVGVSNTAVAAGSYYWAQTGGECSVLADASAGWAKGVEATISGLTAGAVGHKDAAGEPKVGVASEAPVSTEHRAIFLTIN